MDSKRLTTIGVVACGAACAGSLVLPAMLGAGALGLGGYSAFATGVRLDTAVCLVLPVAVVVGTFWFSRQRKAQATPCAADGSCGCNGSGADAIKRG